MVRKLLLFLIILSSGFLLSGCSFKKAPAALQIKTQPTANVLIDGKLLGKTPYQADNLKAGEITLKLIPESDNQSLVSWEGKIKLAGGVLTLIEREFGTGEADSSGQILTLEKAKTKEASLSVVSDPDGALVKIDGDSKGFTPLAVDKIEEGDHEIVVTKDGYTDKTLNAKAIAGYKLVVNVKLATIASPSASPTPLATSSASLTPTVSVTPKTGRASPTPTAAAGRSSGYITVKENSLGFLRVRDNPSGTEIAKIEPIDPQKKYPLLEEKSGWYKIEYETGKEGWVSADSRYTEKVVE
ncbi:MAG: PEGA domain-containing protein [Microgenomates group bacterium]